MISKKAAMTVLVIVVMAANHPLGLGLDDEAVTKLVGLAITYLIAQGAVDARSPDAKIVKKATGLIVETEEKTK